MQGLDLKTRTQLDKVVVLQNILHVVLQVQQLFTLTLPHAESHLHVSVLHLVGPIVPSQGLIPQGPDGA